MFLAQGSEKSVEHTGHMRLRNEMKKYTGIS